MYGKRSLFQEGNARKHVLGFFRSSCPACNATKPAFQGLAEEHPEVEFRPVDVDREEALSDEFEVEKLPTIIVVVSGEPMRRLEGVQTREAIERALT